jgi:hypothetical protein
LCGAAALALLLPADAVPGGVAFNLAAGLAGAALIAMEVMRARGAGRPSKSGPRMGG